MRTRLTGHRARRRHRPPPAARRQLAERRLRLDDGKDLLPQARVTEQQAIRAAQSAASGGLDEVDLEQDHGRLVFNVDVGGKDVKVDAADGRVLGVGSDD